MRMQAILAVLMALSAIILKIVLVGYLGVAGVVWATIIAYGVVTFAPLSFVLPKLLKQFEIMK